MENVGADFLERKIGRGISFPLGVLIRLEEESERAGLSVSEFVVEAANDRLRRAGSEPARSEREAENGAS